jgi:hypothetical protein
MKTLSNYSLSIALLIAAISCSAPVEQTVDLSGTWQFRADPEDRGLSEGWYDAAFEEAVNLPGSMVENGKGNTITVETRWTGAVIDSSYFTDDKYAPYRQPGNIKIPFWLQPEKHYLGAAWYSRQITVPASWKENNPVLKLERCHWETRLWIDGREVGMRNSLGTPQYYKDLGPYLPPGEHTLTIRVDNRIKDINPGINSHSVSDHTQGNWNGIAGEISIEVLPRVYIDRVAIYADPQMQTAKVQISTINSNEVDTEASFALQAVDEGTQKAATAPFTLTKTLTPGHNTVEAVYPLGDEVMLWDEFYPNLYTMQIDVQAGDQRHAKHVDFGFREFVHNGTQLSINGRPVFLRGTLECCIFPKTGYPPTDRASWTRIFKICKAHGLNNMRFHSWCPPKAAFEAADREGFYLQVEASSWARIGDGEPIDQFIYEESERMVQEYGNHPSFCMMAYGNEPAGANQRQWLGEFVHYWKSRDNRRLYTSAAGWPAIPENDFHNIPGPRIQGWGEELRSIINAAPPNTVYDWSDRIENMEVPVVSHEIGQWCVYPNFAEIPKYTGVLKARNFEIFRETLQNNHMGHLADSLLLASGKLQALCYKADIEAALRTPGFGGFHLLQLHDFPGQGSALVGVLDPFFEEKGYISAEQFSRFCNTTVPLARLPKRTFTTAEMLTANIEVAHFGPEPFRAVAPSWSLTDENGNVVHQGSLGTADIAWGNGQQLGTIQQELGGIAAPQKLTLQVAVDTFANSWDIWIYPDKHETDQYGNIRVVQKLDPATADFLTSGGMVLLTAAPGSVVPQKGGDVGVGFSSIFWNTAWTRGQKPHTLGILCDPAHPALDHFPTEYHSNWQWWDAMRHAQALQLNGLTTDVRPIVRIIDDWFSNRRLALILEAKVGKGKLLMTGIDLITNQDSRLEARQLLHSLQSYMTGAAFDPDVQLDISEVTAFQTR